MRIIYFLLQKEFLQIFRNRAMLFIIFILPLVQLFVLGNAATFEVKNTGISLMDMDRSTISRQLIDRMAASGYFSFIRSTSSMQEAEDDLISNRAGKILQIPRGFERNLQRVGVAKIQLILNAEDGKIAGVTQAYASSIIARFNQDIQVAFKSSTLSTSTGPIIEVIPRHRYNPDLDYPTFMVPGILVVLVTMIGTFLSAMNIVREKEIGTIEQLNVTPIRKYQFITGKLLPFWLISLFELAFGLLIAKLVFHIPMLGSLTLIFAVAGVYMLAMLGLGLWISTFTDTQQQAMFIAWFFMVVFILMGGLFTAIESMPAWAQQLVLLNPVAYFIEVVRNVLLKGAGFRAVQSQFWTLVVFAVVLLSLAVRQYRKVTV